MHCYLILLLSLLSFDQIKQERDTLKIKQVLISRTDTVQVFALLRMAELSEVTNLNAAKAYTQKAITLSEKLKDSKCITLSYLQRGDISWFEKKNDQALREYNIALEYANKFGKINDKREANHQIGMRHSELKQYYQAIQFLYQALQLTDQEQQPSAYAYTLFELGKVNFAIKNFPEAIDYYLRSAKFNEIKLKNNHLSALANNGIAMVYDEKSDFNNSIKYYEIAYRFTTKESRLEELGGSIQGNIGYMYELKGDHKKAIEYLKKDFNSATKYNEKTSMLITAVTLSKLYSFEKDRPMSIRYLTIADSLVKVVNNPSVEFNLYRNYAKIYENLGEPEKAISYYKKLINGVDKYYSPKNIDEIATMQIQHRIAFNQKELELLKKSKQLDELILQKANRTNQLLLISVVFLVIVVVFIFVLLRQKVRSNNRLSEKTKIIAEQNSLVSLSNSRLKEVNRQKTEIIGAVSHDLKAPINRLKGLLDLLTLDIRNRDEYISMMMLSINDANGLIQNLLDNNSLEDGKSSLRPTEFDLVTLLNSIIKISTPQANYKTIVIQTEFQVPTLLVTNDKLALTRVIENLLSNALKFSPKSSQILVKLETTVSQHFVVSVTDNGPGISIEDQKKMFKPFTKLSAAPTAGESSTGLGLSIVHKLVQLMKGNIEVYSDLGLGASFVITIPFDYLKAE